MTEAKFSEQMSRLTDVFGAKCYTTPRLRVIYHALRHMEESVFERAITRLIASKRSSPLVPDITEAYDTVLAEDKQRMLEVAPAVPGSFLGQLEHAAKRTHADSEYVALCIKTVQDLLDRRISFAIFRESTDALDGYAAQIDPIGQDRNLKKVNHRWIIVGGLPNGK